MARSDHCPAMKGIETWSSFAPPPCGEAGSDHCPAMKGIETLRAPGPAARAHPEATTAPQ